MAQRVDVAPPLHHRIRTPRGASVVLSVPAHKDYVVIIRSAVAQLAGCFGYPVRDVTDLRLAVNEACALLVAGRGRWGGAGGFGEVAGPLGGPGAVNGSGSADGSGAVDGPGGIIECRAEVRGDVLRVTVSAAAGTLAPDTDGIGWAMLTALVDTLTWAQDGVSARVDLEKRHGAAHEGLAYRAADWERGPRA